MNIYLTLDYELFLGENTGTPENCLIRPMDELCRVADKHNFKFIIFVDATYLLRMHQLKADYSTVNHQYELVSNHVRNLANMGHDVQFHFHPQWLYSTWDDESGRWKMDREHYKLSDLSLDDAKKSLREAKALLDTIVGYKTSAFRAGGFCLDSFQEYKEVFTEIGLRIDSSVARMSCVKSPVHSYDYRNIPAEQIYKFNDSIKEKDFRGSFVELSISSYRWNAIEYFSKIRPIRTSKKPSVIYQDGNAISDGKISVINRVVSTLKPRWYLASIDGEWSNLFDVYYEYAKKKGWSEIVLIGHPKNATDISVSNLDSFISMHNELLIKTSQTL